jgi:hypothetical protein
MSKRSRDCMSEYCFKTYYGYDTTNPQKIQNVAILPTISHKYNPEIELWPVGITSDFQTTYYFFDSEIVVNKFIDEINSLRC